jgi:hypothetical protein
MESLACRREKIQFWWKNLMEGNHVEDLGVDGSITQ